VCERRSEYGDADGDRCEWEYEQLYGGGYGARCDTADGIVSEYHSEFRCERDCEHYGSADRQRQHGQLRDTRNYSESEQLYVCERRSEYGDADGDRCEWEYEQLYGGGYGTRCDTADGIVSEYHSEFRCERDCEHYGSADRQRQHGQLRDTRNYSESEQLYVCERRSEYGDADGDRCEWEYEQLYGGGYGTRCDTADGIVSEYHSEFRCERDCEHYGSADRQRQHGQLRDTRNYSESEQLYVCERRSEYSDADGDRCEWEYEQLYGGGYGNWFAFACCYGGSECDMCWRDGSADGYGRDWLFVVKSAWW
jgi:hypothetical protein